ncbi:MAG: hypothetical protein IJ363_04975 [Clostridia bacterium]|nr:hypothetical protein [Clostridia bacterium]
MFCIRLAGITVEVDNRHNHVYELCTDYRCADSAPAFRVAVSTAEARAYQTTCGRPMTLPEAESYLLYRRICEIMPKYGVFLLHAAVVELDGRGYAFSARRGTGKSTHTELWQTRFQGHAGERYRATVINGDKPLIRRAPDGRFWAYGTPWCGKEGKGVNRRCPLTAICFLEQGAQNRVSVTTTADAAARIMEATILPPDSDGQDRMAALVGATVRDIPAFTLSCRPDMEAVEVAYEFLSQV